jgi:regulation of enolase protein 1 (concanavalin A-like superfamily)
MKKYVSAAALRAALGAALLVCGISNAAIAQTVPSPWTARDIGAPSLSGSATHSSGVFTVNAGGADIWGTSDQFHFVYQAISGDVEVSARVDSLVETDAYAKAGVMIRASLNANAAHGFAAVFGGGGTWYNRRKSTGGSSSTSAGSSSEAPVWLRAVRKGTQVTTYWSSNGSTWTTIATDTIALGTTAYVGLAVTSHNTSQRTTAKLSSVKVIGGGSTGGTLPSGQQSMDLGGPALSGSATYAGGTYTVKAGGKDIWDTSDQFHFVYQQITGNAEVVARVASIGNTDAWSKAGVMIRESLTASSKHAMVVASISKGYAFQRRPEVGGYSEHTSGGSGTAPGWVRLVRTGDLFEAYRSSNGSTWTKIGSDTIAMNDTVYVGLAATSHDVSALATDTFDNVRITGGTSGNNPPSVSITAPASGTTVTAPTTVTIAATASDPEGRMASVDFYAGSTLISRDTTAPYSASWSASSSGTYPLTAVAHDADGNSSTSGAVNVSVQTTTNRPPTISFSTGGTSFTAPANITLSATASDPDGNLARVEFFNGSTRLSSDTSSPYSFAWQSVAAGTYSLRAVAYDSAGASASSATVTVTVTSTTTTTPPKTVVFTASADHATKVTKYVLKIYAATAATTGTPLATSDLGKPAPASTGDITVDRATFFNGLASGSYKATVTAVGSSGESASAAISFTR